MQSLRPGGSPASVGAPRQRGVQDVARTHITSGQCLVQVQPLVAGRRQDMGSVDQRSAGRRYPADVRWRDEVAVDRDRHPHHRRDQQQTQEALQGQDAGQGKHTPDIQATAENTHPRAQLIAKTTTHTRTRRAARRSAMTSRPPLESSRQTHRPRRRSKHTYMHMRVSFICDTCGPCG